MGAFGGAILWSQRAAAQLVSTFAPFCLPWDMEIEWAFLRHNTSVFFASPSLIVQGTFLNPDELGHSVSALRTERNPEIAAAEGEGYGGGATRPKEAGQGRGQAGSETGGGSGGAAGTLSAAGGRKGVGALGGVSCGEFSFFDCTAGTRHSWEECVGKRDECGKAAFD